MRSLLVPCILGIVLSGLMASCTTDPGPAPDVQDRGPAVQEPALPVAADQDAGEVLERPVPAKAAPVVTEPAFQVSREVYDETFNNVKKLIDTLNTIIRNKDYNTWYSYLNAEFIRYFSDPVVLQQQSESRVLSSKGIVLKSLGDYFIHVVVPSRANLRLDELYFLNENEVEAIMVVGGRRISVYRLKKIDNEWKIGLTTGP